jgi:hypothetical protein
LFLISYTYCKKQNAKSKKQKAKSKMQTQGEKMSIPTKLRPIVVYYADELYTQLTSLRGGKTGIDIMNEVYDFISSRIADTDALREVMLNHRNQLILAERGGAHIKVYSPRVKGISMAVNVSTGGDLENAVGSAFDDLRGVVIATNYSSRSEVRNLLRQYDPAELTKAN